MEETRKELKNLVSKLNKDDFKHFCDNYSVDGSKFELVEEWIDDIDDKEVLREVINEINFNTLPEDFMDMIFDSPEVPIIGSFDKNGDAVDIN